jgi:hypothetical protein
MCGLAANAVVDGLPSPTLVLHVFCPNAARGICVRRPRQRAVQRSLYPLGRSAYALLLVARIRRRRALELDILDESVIGGQLLYHLGAKHVSDPLATLRQAIRWVCRVVHPDTVALPGHGDCVPVITIAAGAGHGGRHDTNAGFRCGPRALVRRVHGALSSSNRIRPLWTAVQSSIGKRVLLGLAVAVGDDARHGVEVDTGWMVLGASRQCGSPAGELVELACGPVERSRQRLIVRRAKRPG